MGRRGALVRLGRGVFRVEVAGEVGVEEREDQGEVRHLGWESFAVSLLRCGWGGVSLLGGVGGVAECGLGGEKREGRYDIVFIYMV